MRQVGRACGAACSAIGQTLARVPTSVQRAGAAALQTTGQFLWNGVRSLFSWLAGRPAARACAVALGAAVVAILALPALAGALGFSGSGVMAGSMAAGLMSLWGGVLPPLSAGGAIAAMQSIGATGAVSAAACCALFFIPLVIMAAMVPLGIAAAGIKHAG